jgi:hypothetical protein
MREEYLITIEKELELLKNLKEVLISNKLNASNTIVVTVSTDYSSIVGQYLRHQLTKDGEICEGFGIDVPYPDEQWNSEFINRVETMFKLFSNDIKNKTILLVEAGVIRGSNYTKVIQILRDMKIDEPIVTLALFENQSSKFKSDFVGEYYNDETEDLTFWWERENNHWK